jgi:beta-mannosidase
MTEKATSLNGAWDYLPDPSYSLEASTLPVDGWESMPVPSNWQLAKLDNYKGVVWFRRTFSWPDPLPERPVFVRFKGVDYFADVWLNGEYVGHHEGYFQPFEFNVGPLLKAGDNELLVKVNAPFEEPGPQGWPNRKRLIKGIFNHHDCRPGSSDPERGQDLGTGGIWNDVELIACDAARIERLQITPTLLKQGAAVTVTLHVQNYTPRPLWVDVTAALQPYNFDADGQHFTPAARRLLQPGPNRIALSQTIADPHLWSTWDYGQPNLYTCTATVTADGTTLSQATDQFAIREVSTTPDWVFHLNGQRVFLRGTNVIPTQWLSEYDAETIARDIALLRECNVNSVRIHAHVQREEFYRACDEAGILVWADFALQWSYDDTDEFKANAVSQIRDFVRLLYNRPSIGVWCCHNEPTFNRHTLDPLLAQAVQEEDGTRIVTPASDFSQHTYPGWYGGHWRDYAALPAAPFINEYGAQALPNLETLQEMFDEDTIWPTTPEQWKAWAFRDFQHDQTFNVARIDRGEDIEEFVENSQRYQARLLKFATEQYRAHKWARVNSLFQFMFVECWPSITWAVVDYFRRPKQGYYALKTAYQPVLVSFGGDWFTRDRVEIGSVWSIFSLTNVTVVNDLHQDFPDATLSLSVRTEAGPEVMVFQAPIHVPADDVIKPFNVFGSLEEGGEEGQQAMGAMMKKLTQVPPGKHQLVARLRSADGALLSENQADIEFVAPVMPAVMPF